MTPRTPQPSEKMLTIGYDDDDQEELIEFTIESVETEESVAQNEDGKDLYEVYVDDEEGTLYQVYWSEEKQAWIADGSGADEYEAELD
jgi:hypothetical protein